MSTRNQFLERVRKALGRPVSPPSRSSAWAAPEFPPLGRVLAPVPEKDFIGRFEEELRKVGVVSHQAGSRSELGQTLREILASAGEGHVVLSRNPVLRRLQVADSLQSWGRPVVEWPLDKEVAAAERADFRAQCFSAKAGITGADFALVESGSFVLTSVTEGSQLVSLAPPIHVVLYRRGQVVETLEEVLNRLADGGNDRAEGIAGRSIVFITGQSRTADIEQISIRGVHGPLAVHSILIEDSCLTAASDRSQPVLGPET